MAHYLYSVYFQIRQYVVLYLTTSYITVKNSANAFKNNELKHVKLVKKISTKSCSLDPVPATLLSYGIDDLLPIIQTVVNSSFESAVVPTSMKKAVLSPLLKKHDLDFETFSNFRPISANLKFLSKVIETEAAAERLWEYVRVNGLDETLQPAYKKQHSCETALLRVQNDILMALDSKKCVILLLLDLSAAFDTVDHEILLLRLHSKFGIKGKAHAWLSSYIIERTQFVQINGTNSSVHHLKYGVPQGSVLGPLLYLLYTSPLGDIIRKHGIDFHLYADDIQLYTAFNFENDVELSVAIDHIERCLVDIFTWMAVNKLKFNTDRKTLPVVHQSQFRPISLRPFITVGVDTITLTQ